MSRLPLDASLERSASETDAEQLSNEEPKQYNVLLVNDDYTPMEFVVVVLKRFFYLSDAVATAVMLQVHREGVAVCGVYTRDVAETKTVMVNEYARLNQHPLLCRMEQKLLG